MPVQKFNDTVGPLFAALRGKFPLDDHRDSALQRSLGIFLNFCFRASMDQLEKIRPGSPLTRDEWIAASPEEKRKHLHWQSNLRYLKQRNQYFAKLTNPHSAFFKDPLEQDDDDDAS
jgi:hypothetical protein